MTELEAPSPLGLKSERATSPLRRALINLLKACITFAAIAFIVHKVDFKSLLPLLARCRLDFLALLIASQFLMLTLVAQRWRILWDPALPLGKYLYFVFLGNFFNFFLPSAAASEAIRVLAFGKKYGNMQENIGVNLFARGLGVMLQVFFGIGCLLFFRRELEHFRFFEKMHLDWRLPVLLAVVLSIALFFFLRHRKKILRQRWMAIMFQLAGNRPLLLKALGLTLLIQLTGIAGTYTVFRCLHPGVALWLVIVFPPISQLILMLPISFGGIGVREYLTLLFFSDIGGIPPETTFAVSILAYIPPVLFASIGGLWMAFRRHGIGNR